MADPAPAAPAPTPLAPVPRPAARTFVRQQVPPDVVAHPALAVAAAALPPNYDFELPKTVWRLRRERATWLAGQEEGAPPPPFRVALQFPEGLLLFALTLADALAAAVPCAPVVLADVAYGACCVDDRGARAAGAAALVHYGHSCLVPVTETALPSLYVFVGIAVDVDHLVGSVRLTWPDRTTRLALAGTVQFAGAVAAAAAALTLDGYPAPLVPAVRPLSPGEVLGCTAPALPVGAADAAVFIADGRFHMEALMIANPSLPAHRYDPYARTLLRESYDHVGMRAARAAAVRAAAGAGAWVVVRGTLGRQGAPPSLAAVTGALAAAGKPYAMVLASELTPARVAALSAGGGGGAGGGGRGRAWVQVACPRLSIDWGDGFGGVPVLTPYEAMVALGAVPPWWRAEEEGGDERGGGGGCAPADCSCSNGASVAARLNDGGDPMRGRYAMDFYAADGGPWGATRVWPRPRRARAAVAVEGG